jgi:hypothetical protein
MQVNIEKEGAAYKTTLNLAYKKEVDFILI